MICLMFVGAGLVCLTLYLLMLSWVAQPPSLGEEEPDLVRLLPVKEGSRVRLGPNWLDEREGLPVLYLTGSPL